MVGRRSHSLAGPTLHCDKYEGLTSIEVSPFVSKSITLIP